MKNNKLKFLIIVLVFFLQLFFIKYKDTFAIYKSNLSTSVYLTVLDPNTSITVTLHLNDGTNNTITEYRTYNQPLGNITPSARTDYNFTGWYDSNGNRVYSSDAITTAIDLYAHWQKIVCKKATVLHTETCSSTSGGCITDEMYNTTTNKIITYGTIYGLNSPTAGDAYDCDVNNDGTYNSQDQNGKYTERFYFLKEYEHNNAEETATLIYYTSYDANGRVDSQNTPKDNIGSKAYDTALTWLPTSSTWKNPALTDFDNNGKVTRFITLDEVGTTCGTLTTPFPSPPATIEGTSYFTTCQKWFLFENSRFQSNNKGRAGIWLEVEDSQHYRIQTSAVVLASVAASSENMARPVIEIPLSAFEGYIAADRYTINFDTHGGTPISSIRRYSGEEIGTIDTTTREHFTFDGWYANFSNDTYTTPVTSSTVVTGTMTLHAKWTPIPTNTVTFDANGGTIDGESTLDVVVDTGSTIDPLPTPTWGTRTFVGWYEDDEAFQVPFTTSDTVNSDLKVYAKWQLTDYAASVNGVGYASLAEALAAVPTTGVKTTVTILKNITLDEAITIPNTKWVELDGGSYTISGNDISITNNGKLNIISGTITSTATAANNIISNNSGAILNISGGNINATGNVKNSIISNASGATVNISGGTLTNDSTAGTLDHTIAVNSGTLNITGGSLNTFGKSAAINNNDGTLTMSGGEIHANSTTKGQAIYIAGGTVNISGTASLSNVSSTTTDSRATVDNNGGTLIITGGTIVSSNYAAVENRASGKTTRIGTDDGAIDITTPVLRGKTYGSNVTKGTIYIYDGIFESQDNTRAVNADTTGDNNGAIEKPNGIDFRDSDVIVDGVTYHSSYLFAPTVTVTFNANGGTVEGQGSVAVTVDNGDPIGADMPANPIRSNYYFDGWYDSNNVELTSSTEITITKTVYAKWVQDFINGTVPTTLSVQINSTGNIVITGTDLEDVTYTSSDPTIATVDADGTVHGLAIDSTTITITGTKSGITRTVNVTVTPEIHTVRFFDSDGQTLLGTRTVANGSSLGVNMYNGSKTNYVLEKWTIKDTINDFTSATSVTGDIDVVATWKETVNYATLSTIPSPFEIYEGTDGTITLSATTSGDTVEDFELLTADSNIATVNNHTVIGVSVGTINITIRGLLSTETRTVQVTVSTTQVTMRTVTFKDDDNTTVLDIKHVADGSSLDADMPANPTDTNYIFDGWYIDGITPTLFTSSTVVENGDVVVIARWKAKLNISTVTATVSPNPVRIGTTAQITLTDSSGRAVENVTYSSSNTNIATVSNSGEVSAEDVGTVTITMIGGSTNQQRTIEVTVTNRCTITFKDDSDNVLKTILVASGSTIDATGEALPSDPTPESGYVFENWYLYENNALTSTHLNTSSTVTDDAVYKPKWVSDTYYAVTYAASGTTYHTTLQSAFTAAPTDNVATEVKILQDITNPVGQTQILNNRNIILNGGSHTMTAGSATTNRMIFNDGTLRVKSGTYICGVAKLATFQNSTGRTMYVDGGWIEQNYTETADDARGAIYNEGTVIINGGTLKASAPKRGVVQNATNAASSITMNGGEVIQAVDSTYGGLYNAIEGSSITITDGTVTSSGNAINNHKGIVTIEGGTITSTKIGVTSDGGTVTITGGTVTSQTNGVSISSGALVIGTQNSTYDVTSPIIQGDTYGVNVSSGYSSLYSIFDGTIKGKRNSRAVSDFSKIDETNGIETGAVRQTGTDGAYYTLYYTIQQVPSKYHIDFNAGDGSVSPAYLEFDLNQTITASDLPTPTNGVMTFDGWYTDNPPTTPFSPFAPSAAATVTYYAKWSYTSSTTPVNHIITSDAMTSYFNNISTYVAADSAIAVNQDSSLSNDNHTAFTNSLSSIFTTNNCSECNGPNTCTSPGAGVRCDYPKDYNTGLPDDLVVYPYENGVKGSTAISYVTSDDGVIYNMIPGKTYYWESSTDNTKYGVVTASGSRRTLHTDVLNLRDLGGMSASYTDLETGNTVNGTIDYGRLYRGAQITSQQGVTDLNKLGITREIDLRANGDGTQTYKLSYYDTGTSQSYNDIVITNYHINPVATTYLPTEADASDECMSSTHTTHLQNYRYLKDALRKVMEYVVFNNDNIFFHCTIGTDRTGTLAYFLEGLLGVSEEDRLRDYELSYFYGLTNRMRFHDTLSSKIVPRFFSMYKSYPTNADIYAYYKYESHVPDPNDPNDLTDDELLTRFRRAIIH